MLALATCLVPALGLIGWALIFGILIGGFIEATRREPTPEDAEPPSEGHPNDVDSLGSESRLA
jgi:hypothetical protein